MVIVCTLWLMDHHCSLLLHQDISIPKESIHSWLWTEASRVDKVQKIQEHCHVLLQHNNLECGGSLNNICTVNFYLSMNYSMNSLISILSGFSLWILDCESWAHKPDQDWLHHGHLRPHPRPLHPGHEVRDNQGGAVWFSGHTAPRSAGIRARINIYWEQVKNRLYRLTSWRCCSVFYVELRCFQNIFFLS